MYLLHCPSIEVNSKRKINSQIQACSFSEQVNEIWSNLSGIQLHVELHYVQNVI